MDSIVYGVAKSQTGLSHFHFAFTCKQEPASRLTGRISLGEAAAPGGMEFTCFLLCFCLLSAPVSTLLRANSSVSPSLAVSRDRPRTQSGRGLQAWA